VAAAAPAKKVAGRRSQAAGTRSARNARALERARTTHKTATRAAPARRKSGPAPRPKAAARPAQRPATRVQRPAPKTVARVAQSGGSVLLDRLLRGRAWVFLIGALLAGIVFLNVSVLELNRGIAQTDAAAEKLERKNSLLREKVASLDSAERIQELAEARGYVLPAPGAVQYLDPNRAKDAKLAAQRIETEATTTPVETPAPVATPEPVAAPEPEPVAIEPTAYSPDPSTTVAPTTP
jgi:hypothetical protein